MEVVIIIFHDLIFFDLSINLTFLSLDSLSMLLLFSLEEFISLKSGLQASIWWSIYKLFICNFKRIRQLSWMKFQEERDPTVLLSQRSVMQKLRSPGQCHDANAHHWRWLFFVKIPNLQLKFTPLSESLLPGIGLKLGTKGETRRQDCSPSKVGGTFWQGYISTLSTWC